MVGNSGIVLTREDNGAIRQVLHSSGVDFSSVIVLDDERFLLVGEDGLHFFPEAKTGEAGQ